MTDKTRKFAALHIAGAPLELYNCWDAGSAAAIAAAGAPALATGSWAVAAAQGYDDGEALPMADLLALVGRIISAQDLPVSVDFEGAYGDTPQAVAQNARALQMTGAVGMNFEDRHVAGSGLWTVDAHSARIAAVRSAVGSGFFINARTDVFMQARADDHAGLVAQAVARGRAYARAGASGFFVPMLGDAELIALICAQVPLPVNVMVHNALADHSALRAAGVARISHGPASFVGAMAAVTRTARQIYGTG